MMNIATVSSRVPSREFWYILSSENNEKSLYLFVGRGIWRAQALWEGATLHIIDPVVTDTSAYTVWTVDDQNGMIVLEPFFLVTPSAIVSGVSCARRFYLNKTYAKITPSFASIRGRIAHAVFQNFLADPTSLESAQKRLVVWEAALGPERLAMHAAGETSEDELRSFLRSVDGAARRWLSRANSGEASELPTVLAVEEQFASVRLGIRGRVDLVALTEQEPFPVEIKTGKVTNSKGAPLDLSPHHAQALLYIELMRENYGSVDSDGALVYLRSVRDLHRPVTYSRRGVARLVALRNKGVASLQSLTAPSRISNTFECQYCFSASACAFQRVLVNGVDADCTKEWGREMPWVENLKHDRKQAREHVARWLRALDAESEACRTQDESSSAPSWLGLRLERLDVDAELFTATLTLSAQSALASGACPFKTGDRVQVFPTDANSGRRLTSYLSGTIQLASDSDLCLLTYTLLPEELALLQRTSARRGDYSSLEVPSITVYLASFYNTHSPVTPWEWTWRMTTPLRGATTDIAKSYLYSFWTSGWASKHHAWVFRQQVRIAPPPRALSANFRTDGLFGLSADEIDCFDRHRLAGNALLLRDFVRLNSEQRQGVVTCLDSERVALLLGVPGAGKTTVIVFILRCVVAMNKRVLLTSYTHTAVDTVLRKCPAAVRSRTARLRSGNSVQIDGKDIDTTSLTGVATQLQPICIFASTILGLHGHVLVQDADPFDYCIVDEATQITHPVVLGALVRSKRVIMVGDPHQLPPLVRSTQARALGLAVSLFEDIWRRQPSLAVQLNTQYRMSSQIMALSNALFYDNRMKQGVETPRPPGSLCWVELGDHAEQTTGQGRVFHPEEARAAAHIANSRPRGTVGIICMYREQVHYVERNFPDLEVDTVDRYQGSERETIVLCLTRANAKGEIGRLLPDKHRLNVALTRARTELFIIGHRKTVLGNEWYAELLSLIDATDGQRVAVTSIIRSTKPDFSDRKPLHELP